MWGNRQERGSSGMRLGVFLLFFAIILATASPPAAAQLSPPAPPDVEKPGKDGKPPKKVKKPPPGGEEGDPDGEEGDPDGEEGEPGRRGRRPGRRGRRPGRRGRRDWRRGRRDWRRGRWDWRGIGQPRVRRLQRARRRGSRRPGSIDQRLRLGRRRRHEFPSESDWLFGRLRPAGRPDRPRRRRRDPQRSRRRTGRRARGRWPFFRRSRGRGPPRSRAVRSDGAPLACRSFWRPASASRPHQRRVSTTNPKDTLSDVGGTGLEASIIDAVIVSIGCCECPRKPRLSGAFLVLASPVVETGGRRSQRKRER